jgi:PEP-CTERM motif
MKISNSSSRLQPRTLCTSRPFFPLSLLQGLILLLLMAAPVHAGQLTYTLSDVTATFATTSGQVTYTFEGIFTFDTDKDRPVSAEITVTGDDLKGGTFDVVFPYGGPTSIYINAPFNPTFALFFSSSLSEASDSDSITSALDVKTNAFAAKVTGSANFTGSTVPEPSTSTLLLLGFGMVGLGEFVTKLLFKKRE